jgi:phosphoglycolate phosphatase-like HAD superfamily hydrolase
LTAPGHVVFDLDDTLIDTAGASFAAWQQVTTDLGLQPPARDDFAAAYRELSFRGCHDRWVGARVGFEELAARYRAAIRYEPIGDVAGLLAQLAGYGTTAGLVTNSVRDEALRKLASAGIPADALAYVVARAPDAPWPLPAKDLTPVLGAHGIDPPRAVHVSDNPADLAPSVRAGVPFRGVLSGVYTPADFAAAGVPAADVHPDVHAAVSDALRQG